MAKKAKAKPKRTAKQPSTRTRQLSKKQQRAKLKKEAEKQTPIPGSFKLTAEVFKDLRRFWRPLGAIFIIYVILNLIFATGFLSGINSSVNSIRSDIGHSHNFSKALNGYGSLLGSGTNGNNRSSSAVQTILLIIESLAIIWALRHLLAGDKIRAKAAYYQSMTPLIPFILVGIVIVIQLLPLTIGSVLLALVLSSAFVSGSILTILFSILLALLAAWSLYLISSSIFALYIVTLPEMQPRQALRSARNLVRFRRWPILRRLLFLPLVVFVLIGVIIIPIILLVPFLTTTVFFVLTMLTILFVHTYLYNLYRGLIA